MIIINPYTESSSAAKGAKDDQPSQNRKSNRIHGQEPTLIATVNGCDLYEHPTLGDEAPLFAITKDGRVKRTDYWELPDAMEALELFDL